MDSDFLSYCVLSIIILSTKNKYVSIISCILFGIFIFFTRDTFGAPDSAVYVEFFTDNLDAKGYGFSKTYGLLRYLLIDIFSIPGLIAYQITTLIPLFAFSLISIREKYIFPIFFFVSSEAFPILSFNAMRQGLGISLLILSFYFIKETIKNKNINKNLLVFLLLFFIFTTTIHGTIFGFTILIIILYLFLKFKSSLSRIISQFKIKKSFIVIFLLAIILISFLIALILYIKIPYVALGIEYLSRRDTYSSGIIGSLYRIFVMILMIIYPYFRNNNYKIFSSLKELTKNEFTFLCFLSVLSFMFVAPISPQLFNRFSYFYIIPILFNSLNRNRNYILLMRNSTALFLFTIAIGLITYSSNAINVILYQQ